MGSRLRNCNDRGPVHVGSQAFKLRDSSLFRIAVAVHLRGVESEDGRRTRVFGSPRLGGLQPPQHVEPIQFKLHLNRPSMRTLLVSVDWKTKNSTDAQGNPLVMVNVLAHDLKLCLAQCPASEKRYEPGVLREQLGQLFECYPGLRLLISLSLYLDGG